MMRFFDWLFDPEPWNSETHSATRYANAEL